MLFLSLAFVGGFNQPVIKTSVRRSVNQSFSVSPQLTRNTVGDQQISQQSVVSRSFRRTARHSIQSVGESVSEPDSPPVIMLVIQLASQTINSQLIR